MAFAAWISRNAVAGAVIPGSGGCRKVQWTRAGHGKRGGVRVNYFVRRQRGEVWLLYAYAKSARDTVPASVLRQWREELDDGEVD